MPYILTALALLAIVFAWFHGFDSGHRCATREALNKELEKLWNVEYTHHGNEVTTAIYTKKETK